LPNCPKCGNKELLPTRTFSVIVEPTKGEKGMTERKVGMYTCSKCNTKFPTVVAKQHYLIVAEEELRKMQDEMKAVKKDNEGLLERVKSIESEHVELQRVLARSQRSGEIHELELKLNELESYVVHLRKDKEELEQRASRSS
jgi:septal ring factor EnvC (AmiA/AmiB activator)